MNNKITIISPYQHHGVWVFDDESVGLVKEAFVAGMDLIIDKATEHLDRPEKGFNLLFSDAPFPGFEITLEQIEIDEPSYGGQWYYCDRFNKIGWLCPALLLYYSEAPKSIYVKVLAKNKRQRRTWLSKIFLARFRHKL